MNWGRSILLVYFGFVALIMVMVFKSFNNGFDLVSEDYYADELKYQDRINATENALPFADSIDVAVGNESIDIHFPASLAAMQSGEAYFYKPSDAKQDLRSPIKMNDSGVQQFAKSEFSAGVYRLKMTWTMQDKTYYVEKLIKL